MKCMKIIYVLLLFLIINLTAQDSLKYELDEVYVSAGRMPVGISNSARIVTVIKTAELAEVPVKNIQDVLQYIGGLDLKQRGVTGVQADLSIRGSTFEQSLVMIDGVKIIDPQTGHHNLNLSLSLNDIERVEVVKGQASKTFGPNAFGGIVNIITRKYTANSLTTELEGGQYGYNSASVSGSYELAGIYNRLSFNRAASDGYRYNTEFNSTSFNYISNYSISSGSLGLLFGFNEKDFGANSFYSLSFPDQAEHTITKFVNVSANLGIGDLYIYPKLYWRRNDDEFVLDKNNPGFYKNLHETNSYGAEVQSTVSTEFGITSLGFEFTRDEIVSTNLGEHERNKAGLFFEHALQATNRLNVNLGGFIYKYSDLDWQLWPGLDASYLLSESIKIFLSVGKAFRIPTYTELYYNDPVTLGNADLKQEESVSYELGITFNRKAVDATVTAFRREGKNTIDWVRTDEDSPWSVRNIAEVNTNGFEIDLKVSPQILNDGIPVSNLSLTYTYLDSDKKTDDLNSRYVLDYLHHQVVAGLAHDLIYGISANWFLRYEDRLNFEESFITDLKLNKSLEHFEISVSTSNLFNKVYHDIAGVTLPGRWIKGSVRYSVEF